MIAKAASRSRHPVARNCVLERKFNKTMRKDSSSEFWSVSPFSTSKSLWMAQKQKDRKEKWNTSKNWKLGRALWKYQNLFFEWNLRNSVANFREEFRDFCRSLKTDWFAFSIFQVGFSEIVLGTSITTNCPCWCNDFSLVLLFWPQSDGRGNFGEADLGTLVSLFWKLWCNTYEWGFGTCP